MLWIPINIPLTKIETYLKFTSSLLVNKSKIFRFWTLCPASSPVKFLFKYVTTSFSGYPESNASNSMTSRRFVKDITSPFLLLPIKQHGSTNPGIALTTCRKTTNDSNGISHVISEQNGDLAHFLPHNLLLMAVSHILDSLRNIVAAFIKLPATIIVGRLFGNASNGCSNRNPSFRNSLFASWNNGRLVDTADQNHSFTYFYVVTEGQNELQTFANWTFLEKKCQAWYLIP